jgi:hypothetical protein
VSRAALLEASRVIRESRPIPPSSVSRTLRGDIETITLKALEKDRKRRYQSAASLAQDIMRYLANEPVEAHPARGEERPCPMQGKLSSEQAGKCAACAFLFPAPGFRTGAL